MKYLVIIERGPKSFGAYVPDLPGCVAVAGTRREVKKLIREAIQLHVRDLPIGTRGAYSQTERGERGS